MKVGLAIGLWVILAVIAVANGTFGKFVVSRWLGDYGSHVYKSIVVIVAVFAAGWFYARQTQGSGWVGAALGAGLLWLGMTVTFEFIAGHYLFGNPWESLFKDYRIWKGRLWSLVLLSDLAAPFLMGWRLNR